MCSRCTGRIELVGHPVLRKKLRRGQVLECLAKLPPCVVVMEACASGHYWGREIDRLDHYARLIPPGLCEAIRQTSKERYGRCGSDLRSPSRPTMRFVAVKSEDTQTSAIVLRARQLLVRQRTQLINALRGHLGEFGQVALQGAVKRNRTPLDDGARNWSAYRN